MPGTGASSIDIHITNFFGLLGFVILWLGLVEGSKILLNSLRNQPLIGWAVGPLGVSMLFLYEPSARFLLLNAFFPALLSGGFLYFGLFSSLPSPLALPHNILAIILVVTTGVLITNLGDWLATLRDLRYPLWGEARILQNIQYLRARWASIHFTAFGLSYLREHFASNPSDLLQAL